MSDTELIKHISEAIATWETGEVSSYDTVANIEELLAQEQARRQPLIPPEMIG